VKVTVIGLGNFGLSVAKSLFNKGHDVLTIDRKKELLQKAREFSTQAVVGDGTDKELLMSLGIHDMDVVIIGIGTNLAASILTTMHMKELDVKRIIARAIDEDHGNILTKVGATDVVFPERDMAIKVAESLHSPNIIDFLPITDEYEVVNMVPPKPFIGKTIREIDLRKNYDIQVIAVRELVPERIHILISPDFMIKDSDVLVVVGRAEDIAKVEKLKKT
jgi:trk system potassium uptake protein TrkA